MAASCIIAVAAVVLLCVCVIRCRQNELPSVQRCRHASTRQVAECLSSLAPESQTHFEKPPPAPPSEWAFFVSVEFGLAVHPNHPEARAFLHPVRHPWRPVLDSADCFGHNAMNRGLNFESVPANNKKSKDWSGQFSKAMQDQMNLPGESQASESASVHLLHSHLQ